MDRDRSGSLQRLVFQMGLVGRPEGRVDPAALNTYGRLAQLKVGDALKCEDRGEGSLVQGLEGGRRVSSLVFAPRRGQAVAGHFVGARL